MKNQFGVIGLSVMGRNLALNIADHGYKVAVFNRTTSVVADMLAQHAHKNITGAFDLSAFVDLLQRPRKIMIMVKAGQAVDAVIEQLIPLLDEGDIIIDGGNSFFEDTQRRYESLREIGLHFFGVGVSGGEEGARFGPALMPGGDERVYNQEIRPILEAIAAKVNGEIPCCQYTSTGGAGHYVKMVHNGIEYGDMQLIAESYMVLKHLGGLTNEELAEVFTVWNQEELASYLIEITAHIFKVQEEDGTFLVDHILDVANQKGTGKWTSKQAADLSVDTAVITAALNARYLSALKSERVLAAAKLRLVNPKQIDESQKQALIQVVRESLFLAKIISYAQGFKLLREAAKAYYWEFDYGQIAKIFRGGCIIQAKFLDQISEAFARNPQLENLLLDEYFSEIVLRNQNSLRELLKLAIDQHLAVSTMSAALSYLDAYTTEDSGANLIQAQRDYFGSHTFARKDKEGLFHFDWVGHHGQ